MGERIIPNEPQSAVEFTLDRLAKAAERRPDLAGELEKLSRAIVDDYAALARGWRERIGETK